MMTLTQYKKVIKSLTRDELEAHLFEIFKSSKVFKDIESSCWNVASNDELMASLRKRLEKVFWKEQFSLSECKGVLNDYLSRTVDEGTKALMHPDFFSLHETEFENLISPADPLGYGVSDDLGYMMENVRIELGYYDDPDENK